MVNDLTTLSGALIECKDQLITELANKGVTASYSSTTGLLGLISHIADIQGGEAILLTTNKNILSYADSETATLTAVHNGGSGKSLAVYNAVSGAKIGDMTDNQDGTYSYTYSSTGTGDISMTCATPTGESNSILIEDCTYYNPDTITSTTTVDISLPSNLILSFKVKRTSSSNNSSYLEIGGNTGNTALMGQVGGSGVSQFRTYASEGSTSYTTHETSDVPLNTETLLVWTKDGTSQSYSTGNSTVTWTDNQSHPKIRKLTINNNRIQELKVKPLSTQ